MTVLDVREGDILLNKSTRVVFRLRNPSRTSEGTVYACERLEPNGEPNGLMGHSSAHISAEICVHMCQHCFQTIELHPQGQCLFGPTRFTKHVE